MKIKTYLFSTILFVLFFSCNSPQQRELISEAKKLSSTVSELNTKVDNFPVDSLNQINNTVSLNIQYVNEHMDELNVEGENFIKDFGPYASSGKIISRLLKKKLPYITEQLNYTTNQVNNLLHDIKKDRIPDSDSVIFYLKQEKQEVLVLKSEIDNMISSYNTQRDLYFESNQKVEKLIKASRKGE